MTLSGHASPEACLGVFISFTAISFLAVALRLYTRMVVLHRAGLDDILIGGAMVCIRAASKSDPRRQV